MNHVRPLPSLILVCLSILVAALAAESASAAIEYRSSAGSSGQEDGQFLAIRGVDVDSQGDFYATNAFSEKRVQAFGPDGAYLRQWGSEGTADGQFSGPIGIAVDDEDRVYVVDVNLDRVQVFSRTGTFLRRFGTTGSGNGQLSNPTALDVDADGNVWVVDTANQRVQAFAPDGSYLLKFGSQGSGPGQFNSPEGGIHVTDDGRVLVADTNNHRVEEFTTTGAFVRQWGSQGSGPGQFQFTGGIDTDAAGNVLVSDVNGHRVQQFTPTGEFMREITTTDATDGDLGFVNDIAVSDGGEIHVTDASNDRVAIYSIVPTTTLGDTPTETSTDGTASFAYSTDENGAGFECAIDGAAFAPCPRSGFTAQGLADGEHTFEVRAIYGDNADETPESATFTVDVPQPGPDPDPDPGPNPDPVADSAVAGPQIVAKATQKVSGKRIAVAVAAGADEAVEISATGSIKFGRGTIELKPVSSRAAAGTTATVRLVSVGSGAARGLAKKLAGGRKAKAQVTVELRDRAGNEAGDDLAVTLVGKKRR